MMRRLVAIVAIAGLANWQVGPRLNCAAGGPEGAAASPPPVAQPAADHSHHDTGGPAHGAPARDDGSTQDDDRGATSACCFAAGTCTSLAATGESGVELRALVAVSGSGPAESGLPRSTIRAPEPPPPRV